MKDKVHDLRRLYASMVTSYKHKGTYNHIISMITSYKQIGTYSHKYIQVYRKHIEGS